MPDVLLSDIGMPEVDGDSPTPARSGPGFDRSSLVPAVLAEACLTASSRPGSP
jgi:hypothetical protein